MVAYTAGSYVDGRSISEGLEQPGTVKMEGMAGSPLIFPTDIGSPGSFNGHFMVIDILEEGASIGEPEKGGKTFLSGFAGRGPRRKIYKAEQSIVLYMPSTLAFTTQNDYEDVTLTSISQKLISAASASLGQIAEGIATGAKYLGRPINPATEVIFSNTTLRKFQFDFLFAPSSSKESETLKEIVYQMRLAASVRKDNIILDSLLWIPPRKLQLRFYSKINGITTENFAFPKLKPCVIENLDFDFAPTGAYSTFSNGYPVSTRMMLRIKEDEVIDREWIEMNDHKEIREL